MKKTLSFLAICVVLTLMACGGGSTTTESTDSTAVASDTVAVQSGAATDSVAVK